MAIGNFKFGNVTVLCGGNEIEATCPSCCYCIHELERCPIKYKHLDGMEFVDGKHVTCKYFIPEQPHIWYKNQWWS